MAKGKPHKSKSKSKECYLPKTNAMNFGQFVSQEKNEKKGIQNRDVNLQKKHIKRK